MPSRPYPFDQFDRELGALPVAGGGRRDLGVAPDPHPVPDLPFAARSAIRPGCRNRCPGTTPGRRRSGIRHRQSRTTMSVGAVAVSTSCSVITGSCSRVRPIRPCAAVSLRILPVDVRGSSRTKSTDLGALNFAMCSLTWPISSAWPALLAGGQHHERLRPLAPALVRDGDHGDVGDRGMGQQRVLHLDGGDVLAAGDDDVLGPVHQLDVAVGVAHPEIAGVEPAAA